MPRPKGTTYPIDDDLRRALRSSWEGRSEEERDKSLKELDEGRWPFSRDTLARALGDRLNEDNKPYKGSHYLPDIKRFVGFEERERAPKQRILDVYYALEKAEHRVREISDKEPQFLIKLAEQGEDYLKYVHSEVLPAFESSYKHLEMHRQRERKGTEAMTKKPPLSSRDD